MTCQECGQPATVHVTDIVQKKKNHTHLCDACAKARGLLPDPPGPALNLAALVQLLMGQPAVADPPACPACGLSFAQFRATGRFGCPHEYDIFRGPVEPLLHRVHRDTAHTGKRPLAAARREELVALRAALAAAVAAEDYERAATLRDRVRQREASDEPG